MSSTTCSSSRSTARSASPPPPSASTSTSTGPSSSARPTAASCTGSAASSSAAPGWTSGSRRASSTSSSTPSTQHLRLRAARSRLRADRALPRALLGSPRLPAANALAVTDSKQLGVRRRALDALAQRASPPRPDPDRPAVNAGGGPPPARPHREARPRWRRGESETRSAGNTPAAASSGSSAIERALGRHHGALGGALVLGPVDHRRNHGQRARRVLGELATRSRRGSSPPRRRCHGPRPSSTQPRGAKASRRRDRRPCRTRPAGARARARARRLAPGRPGEVRRSRSTNSAVRQRLAPGRRLLRPLVDQQHDQLEALLRCESARRARGAGSSARSGARPSPGRAGRRQAGSAGRPPARARRATRRGPRAAWAGPASGLRTLGAPRLAARPR